MTSKRRHEGYLMIDHRASPGLPGQPQGLMECATITCSHCQVIVVLNPKRTRERGYCKKCDHYICDNCTTALHQTGICKPFREVIYEAQVQADKGLSPAGGHIIIPSQRA